MSVESRDTQSEVDQARAARAAQLTARFDHFAVELLDQIAIIIINRPDKLNSMTAEFWGQLS